jgi:hypothetical protein
MNAMASMTPASPMKMEASVPALLLCSKLNAANMTHMMPMPK